MNNTQSVNMTVQNAADHSNGIDSMNIRQSAQIEKEAVNNNTNLQKNANSQQF